MNKPAKKKKLKVCLNLILLIERPGKALRLLRILFLMLLLIPFLGGRASGQTNEKLAEDLVKNNWNQLKNLIKISKNDSLVLIQSGEPSPMARYFFSSLNSVLQKEGFKNIFWKNAKLKNGLRIESYLKNFSIHYFPIITGLFKQKKFLRIGELIQNIQVVNISNGRVLWSGDLASAKKDTLTQKNILEFQKSPISFLRGEMERTERTFRTYLELSFLAGVSIAVIVLFFSIRTT